MKKGRYEMYVRRFCEHGRDFFFFFQAEDGIRDFHVSRVQSCALPIFHLPLTIIKDLNLLDRKEGATPFMTLLAAFQTLLHRYGGQDDIVVGTPIAGRTRVEVEGLIGFFVNMLVLRTDASGDPTFRELLKRVKKVALGAYAHQDIPFEKVVEELHPRRDPSRNLLFQVAFALQNTPRSSPPFSGLKVSTIAAYRNIRFDLEVHLT